jgi:hypothetical protein
VIRNLVHLLGSQLAVLSPATILPYSNCVVDSSYLAEVIVTPMTQLTIMAATVTGTSALSELQLL